MKKVLRSSLNTLRTVLVLVLGVVIAALFTLRSPWVQERLCNMAEHALSQALGGEVSVASIEVSLPAMLMLTEVHVQDPQGEEVAHVQALGFSMLDMSWWRLITKTDQPTWVNLNSVWLVQPRFHLFRDAETCRLNIDYLLGEDKPDSPRKASNLKLQVRRLHIEGGAFRFEDYSKRSQGVPPTPGKLDWSYLEVVGIDGLLAVRYEDSQQLVEVDLEHLAARETRSGLNLERLTALATFKPSKGLFPHVELKGLDLLAAGSELHLDASLLGDFNHVPDSLGHVPPASLCLRQSLLDFRLLNFFLPKDLPLQGQLRLRADFNGNLDSLASPALEARIGALTQIHTTAVIRHLLSPDRLAWELGLASSRVDFAELDSLVIPEIPLRDTVWVQGMVKGDLHRIRSKELELRIGRSTRLFADVRLDEYARPEEMILNIKLKPSLVSLGELHRVIPKLELPDGIDNLGTVSLEGDYLGGISDFVVNASMDSRQGSLQANLHMQLPPKVGTMAYSGWLTTQNLNINSLHLVNGDPSGRLNFDGRVNGQGSSLKNLNLFLTGKAVQSDLFGYEMQELTIDSVHVAGETITGTVKVKDPHGSADVSVDVHLGESPKRFEVRGAFEELDLRHYAKAKDSLMLSSIINVRLSGDSLENFVGRAKFFAITLENRTQDKQISLHDLIIKSEKNSATYKELVVSSSLFDLEMDGNFSFGRGGSLIQRLAKEARLYARNSDTAIQHYYASKVPDSVFTHIDYSLSTKPELNNLLAFFDLPLYLGEGSSLVGEFSSLETDTVDWMFATDSLAYAGVGFREVAFTFDAHKGAMTNDVQADGDLTVSKVAVTPQLRFEDVEFQPTFHRNKIQYWLSGHQRSLGNHFRISAETTFLTDWLVTRINPKVSQLRLRDADWAISNMNRIITEGERITFEDLELTHGRQRITFNGVASRQQTDTLVVGMQEVSIGTLMRLFQNDTLVGGEIFLAEARLSGLLGKPRMLARGVINNFSYQRIRGVQIKAETFMTTGGSAPFIGGNTQWSFGGQRVMKLSGHYRLDNEEMNFVSDSAQLPLAWLSSFVEPWITGMAGSVKVDKFAIRGTPKDIRLEGVAHFEGAHATVDYFKQEFWLEPNASVQFDKEMITLPGMKIYSDSIGGGSCKVNGTIQYRGVKKVMLDLKATEVKDLHVMNTRAKDNELFYGSAYIGGGKAFVTGPYDDVTVTAQVESGPNSWLDIPIADYTSASRLDFLTFTGGSDSLSKGKKRTLAGYNLDLLVDVKPDAKVRIIFDEQVGDVIEAQGEGNLRMTINEQGEFLMYGNYNVTQGNYLFTAENIVNKKFILERDGTISWNGDPYDAQLDMVAVYKVNATISSLLGSNTSSARLPVEIVMEMKGSLASPQIRLDLRIDKLTDEDMVGLSSYLRNITYDEQELNRQVVSLLMFRRFAPATSGAQQDMGPGGAISSSISELVANQLNNWISQTLNANVGVQVNTNEFQDVELGIKANLFDDRVTVERNGTVLGRKGNGGGLGDISVTVKLLPVEKEDSNGVKSVDPYKGQLVMEIFNRENVNVNYTYSNVSGAGIFFKKDFDKLADLFRRRSEEKRRKPKEQLVD